MDDLTPSPRPADEAATDAELVGLVQSLPAGSTPRERAFETLIVRYRPMVRSCARRYQTPPELADELMQAGYRSPSAPAVYRVTQLMTMLVFPLLVFMVWHGIFVEERIKPEIPETVYPVRL